MAFAKLSFNLNGKISQAAITFTLSIEFMIYINPPPRSPVPITPIFIVSLAFITDSILPYKYEVPAIPAVATAVFFINERLCKFYSFGSQPGS